MSDIFVRDVVNTQNKRPNSKYKMNKTKQKQVKQRKRSTENKSIALAVLERKCIDYITKDTQFLISNFQLSLKNLFLKINNYIKIYTSKRLCCAPNFKCQPNPKN